LPALKRPILWALGFLICGIIVGRVEGLPFALFFVGVIFLCAGLYRIFKYQAVIIFAAFFLIGAWRIGHSLQNEPINYSSFSGVVIDVGYTLGGNQRAVVRSSQARIMAYIRPHQPHVRLGQEVTLHGEILPLNLPENPGGYNQFQHLRSQKISATIWPETIERGEIQRSLSVALREFRDRLAAVYDEILPPREAAVMKSMVLGDRLDLDRDLSDLYRAMGIFHILSISGLHITILMLAANKFLGLAMSERRASIVVLILAILYCLMTGAAIPTVRAVSMGGVLVGAKILHREYDLLASVSFVCIALLLYEPLQLFNAGFQLSFGAVFGIGILTAPIERLLSMLRFPHSTAFLRTFRKNFSAGLAAIVSTYIVFAYHFYEIPLYSILGNLIIMPTATIILVLGLLVGLIGLVSMPVALLLSGAVYFILRFYETAAVFVSSLPFAMLRTGGNLPVSLLGVLVLCMFAYTFQAYYQNTFLRGKFLAASILLLVVAVFFQINPPFPQKTELYTHGNYIVLRHHNSTLIIGAPHGGEYALLRYLDKRGVNHASLLLTHPPLPADAERLTRILPRLHTIYLPAHVGGTTQSLMNTALEGLDLPENIVLLHDGEKRELTNRLAVQVHALDMGQFEVIII